MTFLLRLWHCTLLGRHRFGKAVDYDDNTPANGDVLPHGRYKICKLCGLTVPVKRRARRQG